jgi:hypothetical protein
VKEDIIEILRDKEKEMEVLVEKAKQRGVKLREDALKRAEETRVIKAREVQEEIRSMRESEEERITQEVARIEKGAEEAIGELREKAGDRKPEAIDLVADLVLGDFLKKTSKI